MTDAPSLPTEIVKPIEIVKTFLNAMMNKDYAAGLKFVADDCIYDNGPLGKVSGPAGVRGVLEPFFAPTLENTYVIKRSVTDGAVVFIERVDRHRLSDKWVELPVTGVWEVHDGKITVWNDYFDLATILNHWPVASA